MAQILQNVGQNFRVVGPLTLTNLVVNPNFEASGSGNTPLAWNTTGTAVITTVTTNPAYGSHCGRLDLAPTSSQSNGIVQNVVENLQQDAQYFFGQSFNIPVALPGDLVARIDYLDFNGDALSSTSSTLILKGNVTNGWVTTSLTDVVPSGALQATLSLLVNSTGPVVSSYLFFVGKIMFSPVANQYIDGDTAGYVWSGDRYNSTTLQSTMPSDLHFFTPQLVPVT